MFSRSFAAVVVLFVVGSIVLAGTYQGQLVSLNDKEVVINVKKDKKDKEGEKKTFKVTDKTEIFQGAKKDAEPKKVSLGDVTKLIEDKKVGGAKVETEGEGDKEVVVKITIGGGKKK